MTTDPAAEMYRYVDPTEAYGHTLGIAPVTASTYTGTVPVVALGIVLNEEASDPEPIVYVRLDDVERVVKAIREAAGQPEADGERTDREEAERLHAAGDHQYCGATCEVEMPSVLLRNFIVAKGYPGTAGALDELLRRAGQPEGRAAAWLEAAAFLRRTPRDSADHAGAVRGARLIEDELRRLAAEAQQPTPAPAEEPTPQPPRILVELCEQHRPVLEPDPTSDGQHLVSCKACDATRKQIVRLGVDPIPECRFWDMGKAYGYVRDTEEPTL
ncbi:hypothetical protein ACFWFI_09585 [Streptomyces sp. NPDC060209]|uniref:hypothetical protein n=1 Tax=Streptomyces sp. NPDC060209 TaxID=3347073 RepID=UPI0036470F0D